MTKEPQSTTSDAPNLLKSSRLKTMPVNGPKRCGLRGEKNHTVRTCQLPGAQKFRDAIRKTRPVHLKQKARVLRGNGVAAGRKPGKRPPFGRKSLAGILLDTLYLFDLTC